MEEDSLDVGSMPENDNNELTIPRNMKDLRACTNCGLLLNTSQWKDLQERCPNMCDSQPTKYYEGVVCLMQPNKSWAAKRFGVRRQSVLPGIYAIEIFDV